MESAPGYGLQVNLKKTEFLTTLKASGSDDFWKCDKLEMKPYQFRHQLGLLAGLLMTYDLLRPLWLRAPRNRQLQLRG